MTIWQVNIYREPNEMRWEPVLEESKTFTDESQARAYYCLADMEDLDCPDDEFSVTLCKERGRDLDGSLVFEIVKERAVEKEEED